MMRTATIAKTKLFSMPLTAFALVAAFACAAAFTLAIGATAASAKESGASVGGASAPSESEAPTSSSSEEAGAPTLEEEEAELDGISFATWYGPGLFGRHTACGQVLGKQTIGVANRTLPCGTLVAVTYEGHHATIPVIDRGPYGSLGANWDLTEGAARLLHITESVDIRTKIVGHVKNSPELGLSAEAAKKKHQQESGSTGGASA